MATLGLSKVFILDKYFTELQKFWETEKKLQDASSSNEAVHLQQRLKSLSTELVTLRNRLHVGNHAPVASSAISKQKITSTLSAEAAEISQQSEGSVALCSKSERGTGTLESNASRNLSSFACVPNSSYDSDTIVATGTINRKSNPNRTVSCHIPLLVNNAPKQNLTKTQNQQELSMKNGQYHTTNPTSHDNNKKKLYNFSHMLPHNVTSSRNIFIPHPLPDHISEKTIEKPNLMETHETSGQNNVILNSNIWPNRSLSRNSCKQSELQNESMKFRNPCHGLSTITFGIETDSSSHESKAYKSNQPSNYDDLINLSGPLTEDALIRTLESRFKENSFYTNVGSILLSINPYLDVGNPLTLSSTRALALAPQLGKIVQEAVRQQSETGYPQAIILSGTSGAGKTHCSMLLLRQLFAIAGGGPETDAFKHLAAAFTVLRSLGSAKTLTNSESSRIGQFIEVQVTDGALYRTKIHCYFLDQTRVIRLQPNEKNYHIFYQMLVGLTMEERIKLNLEGYSAANLRYLQIGELTQNEREDAMRFQEWKTCLGILGIPFMDVVRVLAAVLLLGNVEFVDSQSLEVVVHGTSELNSVSCLLGIPPASLFRGLTTRTYKTGSQLVKSVCDANMSNNTRDCLAKALYCRTVATIVRRANSLKRLDSTLGTLSSDSNESVHNQVDVTSHHTSMASGNSGSKSMAALNNAVRHATDGFIGILDMFGFEEPTPHAQLEHLCINLCAETMQHFYNTHIFKSSVESCRDEGIVCDNEVDYMDNVPCIDLISSLRTGLLSMLDAECTAHGTAVDYVAKIKVQHRTSQRLEYNINSDPCLFVIRHFAGRVEYDATEFLNTNRDVVPDDLVAVFYKQTCNFGFATHLFGSELKALYALQNVPRGLSFRISPTSHTDLLNSEQPVSTLTQDFHTRLDNLLRTLVHARPHFVRCLRSNAAEVATRFERHIVVKQIRALQVLETVSLIASGFPHRMRFKQFSSRYHMLAPFLLLRQMQGRALEECNLILKNAMENPPIAQNSVSLAWVSGKRHIFMSEGIRQHLEHLRMELRNKSAECIQRTWRAWQWRKKNNILFKCRQQNNQDSCRSNNTKQANKSITPTNSSSVTVRSISNKCTELKKLMRPRPQPITGTPPPDLQEKCDAKLIQQACTVLGLDLERPPQVPPSRPYTIVCNFKMGFPQVRVMKINYPEDSLQNNTAQPEQLKRGEYVNVVGPSSCRGHLIVENKGQSYHVPFQYTELMLQKIFKNTI